MNEEVQKLSLKIDNTINLCKKVLEYGDKIKAISPLDMGMIEYSEKLTQLTEARGEATRVAILELGELQKRYKEIDNDSSIKTADKVLLKEKMNTIIDLSPLFFKQNVILQKAIDIHLKSLQQESSGFHKNVGVIKNYLKAPDKKNFYG